MFQDLRHFFLLLTSGAKKTQNVYCSRHQCSDVVDITVLSVKMFSILDCNFIFIGPSSVSLQLPSTDEEQMEIEDLGKLEKIMNLIPRSPTKDVTLIHCWSSVTYGESTSKQHWINVLCPLRIGVTRYFSIVFRLFSVEGFWGGNVPVNTKHLYNICTTLGQRRRRWADVVQMLYKSFVFGAVFSISGTQVSCRLGMSGGRSPRHA